MSALLQQLNQLFVSGRYSDILHIAQDNSVTPGTSPEAAKLVAAAKRTSNHLTIKTREKRNCSYKKEFL